MTASQQGRAVPPVKAEPTSTIAADWAKARCVTQVVFMPDWSKHAQRNDEMLDVLPVGVLVFRGTGVPVMKFEKGA